MEYILPYIISFSDNVPVLRKVSISWRQSIDTNDSHIIGGIRKKYVTDGSKHKYQIYASIRLAYDRNDVNTIKKVLHQCSRMRHIVKNIISWDYLTDIDSKLPSIEIATLLLPFVSDKESLRKRIRRLSPTYILKTIEPRGKGSYNTSRLGTTEQDPFHIHGMGIYLNYSVYYIIHSDDYPQYLKYKDAILFDTTNIRIARGLILSDMTKDKQYVTKVLDKHDNISRLILDTILKENTDPIIRKIALFYAFKHDMLDLVGYHLKENDEDLLSYNIPTV